MTSGPLMPGPSAAKSAVRGVVRTAVFHPHFTPGGGSEAKAAWTAEAARAFGPVTMISNNPLDLRTIDQVYGTRLASGGIETLCLPPRPGLLKKFDALSGFRLGRWALAEGDRYDVMISTYNPMDFGRPGIQFLADVSFDDELRRRYHPKAGKLAGLAYSRSCLRSVYLGLGRKLSGETEDGWKMNMTVANSAWTKERYEGKLGIRAEVVYPPVPGPGTVRSWADRGDGFVIMARIVPEKGIETAFRVLAKVRAAGYDVHLHILGRADDPSYMRKVGELCRENGVWARYEGLVVGGEKEAFLSRHRFGFSACRGEAFGVSVAEMIKAGMIVWVPDGGGQVEVVGHHPDLVYRSEEEAAAKIMAVLGDGNRMMRLAEYLDRRSGDFSTGRFVSEVRALITRFLEGRTEVSG